MKVKKKYMKKLKGMWSRKGTRESGGGGGGEEGRGRVSVKCPEAKKPETKLAS